jgi:hypothetical protein
MISATSTTLRSPRRATRQPAEIAGQVSAPLSPGLADEQGNAPRPAPKRLRGANGDVGTFARNQAADQDDRRRFAGRTARGAQRRFVHGRKSSTSTRRISRISACRAIGAIAHVVVDGATCRRHAAANGSGLRR